MKKPIVSEGSSLGPKSAPAISEVSVLAPFFSGFELQLRNEATISNAEKNLIINVVVGRCIRLVNEVSGV